VSPATVEVLALVGGAGAYAGGTARAWRAHGAGRVVHRWQAAAFLLGIVAAAAVTLGPFDRVADRSLSGHMAQHVVLMVVCGPLLAVGRPLEAVRSLLPVGRAPVLRRGMASLARRGGRDGWAPMAATTVALYAAVMVVWQLPGPYRAATADERLHGAEHLTMTLAAVAMWWVLLGAGRPRPAAGSIVALFAANLPMTFLGFAMLFARTPWYPDVHGTGLDDQQAAGVILWGVGGGLVVAEAAAVFGWWLATSDRALSPPDGRSGPSSDVAVRAGTPLAR
jgi:cytochrome c oxidase assembly factor CtaG